MNPRTYACTYVCMYDVWMYVCISVCLSVCTNLFVSICMHLHASECMNVRKGKDAYPRMRGKIDQNLRESSTAPESKPGEQRISAFSA